MRDDADQHLAPDVWAGDEVGGTVTSCDGTPPPGARIRLSARLPDNSEARWRSRYAVKTGLFWFRPGTAHFLEQEHRSFDLLQQC